MNKEKKIMDSIPAELHVELISEVREILQGQQKAETEKVSPEMKGYLNRKKAEAAIKS